MIPTIAVPAMRHERARGANCNILVLVVLVELTGTGLYLGT